MRNDPAMSRSAPPNNAGLLRLPNTGVVYYVKGAKGVEQVVLPIEGIGMWGMLSGFIALDRDGTTVRGITFYEQKETPGLGSEISNPKWQALWRGRKAFDANFSYQTDKQIAGAFTQEYEVNNRAPFAGWGMSPMDFVVDFDHFSDDDPADPNSVLQLKSQEDWDRLVRNVRTNQGTRVSYINRDDLRNSQPYRMNPYGTATGYQTTGWETGSTLLGSSACSSCAASDRMSASTGSRGSARASCSTCAARRAAICCGSRRRTNDASSAGFLLSKITFDAQQIAATASEAVTVAIRNTLTIVFMLSYLLYINWQLTLIAFAAFPLVGFALRKISRRLKRVSALVQERTGPLTHALEEAIGAHRIVKVFGGEGYESGRLRVAADRLRLATAKQSAAAALGTPINQIIVSIAVGPVLGWNWGGTADIVEHKVTGWLSQTGDLDGLVEGYHWIRENREQFERSGQGASERVFLGKGDCQVCRDLPPSRKT